MLQKTIIYLIYTGLISLFSIPFIVTSDLFFPFITGKAYFFRIITEIIFFLWIILAFIDKSYRPRKSLLLATFFVFLVLIFISNIFGENFEFSFWSNFERMDGYITLLHLFGLFLVAGNVLKDRKSWNVLLNFAVFAGLIVFFVVLAQLGGSYEIHQGGDRVDATLGNAIYLAVYMLFNFFFAALLIFWNKKNRILPYIYGILALVFAWTIFLTASRGVILGLAVGIAVILGLSILFERKNKKVLKISLIVLILIIIFGGFLFGFKDSNFIQSIQSLERVSSISLESKTAEARILNWQVALEGFKERPILGWGQGNFNLVFDKHYLPEMHGNEVWFDRAHNIVLDWLLAGGILGLLAYISIIFSFFYLLWSKNSSFEKPEKYILTGLMTGYLFQNLFVFDNITSYIAFVLALSYVYSQTGKENKLHNLEIGNTLCTVFVIISLILIPVTIYAVNAENHKANREGLSAVRVFTQNPDGSLGYNYENGLYGNIERFNRAINRDTLGSSEIIQGMYRSIGQLQGVQGIDQKAINDYLISLEGHLLGLYEENPEDSKNSFLLSNFYGYIGKPDLSEQYFKKLIEISPNKQAIRIPIINMYYTNGQVNKALDLVRETYELDKTKDDLWIEYMLILAAIDPQEVKKSIDKAFADGDHEKVIGLYKRLIVASDGSDGNYQNYLFLINYYWKIGLNDDALKTIDEALERFPNSEGELRMLKGKVRQDHPDLR